MKYFNNKITNNKYAYSAYYVFTKPGVFLHF